MNFTRRPLCLLLATCSLTPLVHTQSNWEVSTPFPDTTVGRIEAVGVFHQGTLYALGGTPLRYENGIVTDRRAGRIRNTSELAAALDGMDVGDGVSITFRPATEHRAVLVLSGDRLSSEITNSDPGPANEGMPLRQVEPKQSEGPLAEKTARAVNEFVRKSHEILRGHAVNVERIRNGLSPANVVITRGAGMAVKMRSITDRFDIKGCCISGESTVIGIARMSGFQTVTNEKLTANTDTDLDEKARLTIEALRENDFVVTHVKAADLMAHDGKPLEKKAFFYSFFLVCFVLFFILGGQSVCTSTISSNSTLPREFYYFSFELFFVFFRRFVGNWISTSFNIIIIKASK